MEKKKCTICEKNLPKTTKYFAQRKDRKTICYQSSCRKCQKAYRRRHYENNRNKYIKKAVLYNKKVFEWFKEIRSKLKCEICGEARFWVLDFHHKDKSKKDGNVVVIAQKSGSKNKILQEMAKCKVLCSNCHRDLHYQEKQK